MIKRRGEIWTVDLNPTRGREQNKIRPAVVVSSPNATAAIGMLAIVPLTSTNRGWLWHVSVPADGPTGLKKVSFAMIEQMRSIDASVRLRNFRGQVSDDVLTEIDSKIRLYLGWLS